MGDRVGVAPYAAEIYPTAIRSTGSGVVAGATKLGGVIALGIAVLAWAPPGVASAALIAAAPAGLAALLLLFTGIETRGRRLEEISRSEARTAAAPQRSGPRALRIGSHVYPVLLPSWRTRGSCSRQRSSCCTPSARSSSTSSSRSRRSLTALLTCALIEVVVTFWRQRVILWPASALLTGNGIAFILRVPGTQHGEWWTFRGDLGLRARRGRRRWPAKYLIQFRGRHVFNPSNLGLVLCFLILGSGRSEPLQFWWGPAFSRASRCAARDRRRRAPRCCRASGYSRSPLLFWVTFAGALGILALSGHAFSANWHLGPVADGYFWKVLGHLARRCSSSSRS